MASAGMSMMALAATQLAAAGPLALAGLAVMEAGMIGFLAVAGAMGTQLATATPGLLAFGGAILMAAAGMAILTAAAIQISSAELEPQLHWQPWRWINRFHGCGGTLRPHADSGIRRPSGNGSGADPMLHRNANPGAGSYPACGGRTNRTDCYGSTGSRDPCIRSGGGITRTPASCRSGGIGGIWRSPCSSRGGVPGGKCGWHSLGRQP